MGRKRKEIPPIEERYDMISRMLVSEHILKDFDIHDAKESKSRWVIGMHEKEDRIPEELQTYNDVILDGYCAPVEMLSHSFVCKPVYSWLCHWDTQ